MAAATQLPATRVGSRLYSEWFRTQEPREAIRRWLITEYPGGLLPGDARVHRPIRVRVLMNGVGLRRRRAASGGSPWAALLAGLVSVLVVLAMVAAAVISHQSSDLHRRAQVVAEQIRASSQEMSAFKWRTNTLVLTGSADLSSSGRLVGDGSRILTQLNGEAAQLTKLEPGPDAQRLARDAQRLFAASLQAFGASVAGLTLRSWPRTGSLIPQSAGWC